MYLDYWANMRIEAIAQALDGGYTLLDRKRQCPVLRDMPERFVCRLQLDVYTKSKGLA